MHQLYLDKVTLLSTGQGIATISVGSTYPDTERVVNQIILETNEIDPAQVLRYDSTDTIKITDKDGKIINTVTRKNISSAQVTAQSLDIQSPDKVVHYKLGQLVEGFKIEEINYDLSSQSAYLILYHPHMKTFQTPVLFSFPLAYVATDDIKEATHYHY